MKGLFVVVVLYCIVIVRSQDVPYEGFFKAFPNADASRLMEIPEPRMASVPTEPRFLYNCLHLAEPLPTEDVNFLKPGHIKVVMGMGDSITAGMSALDTNIISMKEYRGMSFSVGLDPNVPTMPNILKLFSPNLYGGSIDIGDRNSPGTGFNAAVSGSLNKDLLAQAQWLVSKLRSDPKVNMQNDWKLLTIWIGSNNLCDVCNKAAENDGANFQKHLEEALDYLMNNIPKLFVNLIGNMDVAGLWNMEGIYCTTIHAIACPCAGSFFPSDRNKVSAVAKDYVHRAYSIANKYNALKRKDFGIAVQPFLTENIIKDRTLLSSADCFHPSNKGHALGAVALWNNMISPFNKKKKIWEASDAIICPSEETRLYFD